MDQFGLLGAMLPASENGTPVIRWTDGPAARAVREGKILILDEVDQHSPELRPILHALTETDPSQIRVRTADGGYLTPALGFGVVCTSNKSPDSLPEALRTRLLSVYVGTPCPQLLETLNGSFADFFVANYSRLPVPSYSAPISPRAGLQIRTLVMHGMTPDAALRAVFGQDVPAGIADALTLAMGPQA